MYIARYSYFTANIAQVEKENKYMLLISELKSNDYLKVDGRKVDVLLLGLRNDYYLHQNFLIARDLQIKSLAIFFLYPLQLQVLAAFL